MLKIQNLQTKIGDKQVLDGVNLEIGANEIHVVMGPNGCGKSTLSKAIMGSFETQITGGSIEFEGQDITEIPPDERAHLGIFLANQYPVEVPGVNMMTFLRLAYNSRFKDKKATLSPLKFKEYVRPKLDLIGMSEDFLSRSLNEGFSGGEKKKSEILQLAVLTPKLAILDETDSGLDIDSLTEVFEAIKKIQTANKMSLLVITHYERVFRFITPNKVHVMKAGKIVKTGELELLNQIQKQGFRQK